MPKGKTEGERKLKIYNEIDEQRRYNGFIATLETGEQVNTHGYSYLFMREQYQKMGLIMGLENQL